MLTTIGHYEITGTLGEGGMGVVYAARDVRLDRTVALKMLRLAESDAAAGERLRREARAAALVNHPNVCQLYDIGEQDGRLFIAMEYLEGESLAARLERGPIPPAEAVRIALAILSALIAIHQRDLIHRDLKPSNVFLTPHAVKLLDFGLACASGRDPAETRMTLPGTLVGTPQYLAPEQLRGEPVDPRGDIFAAGAVLYEMLAGRPAFGRASMAETIHAVAYEHPPALGGAAGVAAIDRVVHKAIAKRPSDRYASALAMADDLRAAMLAADSGAVTMPVEPMTRLIVVPFRVLRADPDIDFLSFGLADALTLSLSGFETLIVRSTLTALSPAETGDLRAIAEMADVDAVLTGTLLRAGDQLRVTTQLVEVPGGTVRWSQSTQVRLGDVFGLQDALTERIVESLALPLSARDARLRRRDVPATARAYECYLRANQLAYQAREWRVARDLYRECLADDPRYAPAWARLGRLYRVLAIYGDEEPEQQYALAEEAFRRALEINPELPIAHNLFTPLEIEAGRPLEALRRLLGRVRAQSADPELFAGLVQACRYAGLDRPAIAAYEHARRLDPQIRTAVSHAYLSAGQYERVIETDSDDPPLAALLALDLLSRSQEAIDRLQPYRAAPLPPVYRFFLDFLLAVFEKDGMRGRAAADPLLDLALRDPCGKYYMARGLALIEHPRALDTLEAGVRGGFHSYRFFMRDPWLDPVRTTPRFRQIVAFAEERYREAVREYAVAGGDRVLGPVSRD